MTDYRCTMHGTYEDGTDWSTRLNVTSNQTPDALLVTFSNAWINAWENGTYGINAFYPTTTQVTKFDVVTYSGTFRLMARSINDVSILGTSSDNSLPYDQSIMVHLGSPGLQRYQRGRSYLPAPVEGLVVNNLYTSPDATRVKTAFQSVLTAINADGSTVFIYSPHPHKDGTGQYGKTVITFPEVDRKPHTQRRRTKGQPASYV